MQLGVWPADKFKVLSGDDSLVKYRSSGGSKVFRNSCTKCGRYVQQDDRSIERRKSALHGGSLSHASTLYPERTALVSATRFSPMVPLWLLLVCWTLWSVLPATSFARTRETRKSCSRNFRSTMDSLKTPWPWMKRRGGKVMKYSMPRTISQRNTLNDIRY